jgi:ubiquinone/menaquinone biosynthesis C-methylase UbiE
MRLGGALQTPKGTAVLRLSSHLLYRLARRWPSPVAARLRAFGAEPGTDAYEIAYSRHQFLERSRQGLAVDVTGKEVLDIGCGHGGIACYLAVLGAHRVVGVDLNTRNLGYAQRLSREIAQRFHPECRLPVHFVEMTANHLAFRDEEFDLVLADNVFEHFQEPAGVFHEISRVLRPGGQLYVPIFSSIYSKYGLHLKHGLRMPWANIVFSEHAIVEAMKLLSRENPLLNEIYPGLNDHPRRVRDLRRYKDLNDITHSSFRRMAREAGLRVVWLHPFATPTGKIVSRIPVLRNSILGDVLSVGATALLQKAGAAEPTRAPGP